MAQTRNPTAALCALALALLILAAAPAAQAFDTQPHNDMTQQALQEEGFGRPAAQVVAVDNFFVDLYSNEKENPFSGHHSWYHPLTIIGGGSFHSERWDPFLVAAADRLHFDPHDANLTGNTADMEAEWDRLQRGTTRHLKDAQDAWGRSQNGANKAVADDAALIVLSTIGVSLHSLQDFYAHTNWVENKSLVGADGPDWPARGQGSTPTWFDLPKGIRDGAQIYAGRSIGHRPHGGWNTNGNHTVQNGMNKDWPGRPFYAEAHETAYFATRQWVRAIRKRLNNEALWARALRFAQRPGELSRDLERGAYLTSLYSGHWQGEGEPCNPKGDWPAPIGSGELSCGDRSGAGGNLLDLRNATKAYFRAGKTRFRSFAEQAIRTVGFADPVGQTFPVESSRDMQQSTRFVRLQVTSMNGTDLGDPGPDDADMFARATIAGQDFDSAVIHSHDRFSFPKPYAPFTWLKPIPVGATYGEPVTEMTVEVRTANDRGAGTDDDVYLRLGRNLRFPLEKRAYDDFERDDRDTYAVPIDVAARNGLTVGDIEFVQIEKSRDGKLGGPWKLGGVTLTVNGRVLSKTVRVERWLEKNRREWRAPDFARRAPVGRALPVWLDLREDDTVYGFDDQGDVNPYDARNALARGYVPGTVVAATTKGGEKHRGRLGKDGDDATVSYRLDTLAVLPPPLPPEPSPQPDPQPDPDPEPDPGPGEDPPPPPPPPPAKPDLVISELGINDFTVKNQGAGPAGAFMVTVVGFGTYNFAALAPGESATRTYSNGCNPAGEVRADSLFQVAESDETNNIKTADGFIC